MESEDDLVQRARAGEVAAFEELLAGLVGPGFRVAMAMLHDRGLAEDAVQDASIKAWRKLDQFKPELRLTPWFLGIVANQCRSTARQRWLKVLLVARAGTDTPSLEDEALERAELRRAIRRLPHDQLAAVVLHFYLDLPLEQVASAMGWTVPSVKGRLHRAKGKLRQGLAEGEVLA